MTEQIRKLYRNQGVRYIFFGGCTTLVNLVTYACVRRLLGMDITAAGFVSVATAILFAYVVNKLFVFESRTPGIKALLIEFAQFVGARFLTMLIEVFGVLMLHDVWKMNDMAAKLVIQVVVMVVNYIFSKLYVFKEKTGKNGEKDRKRRNGILALCFFIPAVTMGVAFALNGVFPFGDRGVLIIDSLHQYLPFFTEFHEKLANNETLLYSFGGGLGFNFWATFAYYLASPLNLIVTFFPKSEMMDVMALLIVLRIGLCGLTFGWYMLEKKQYKNGLPVMFACMYALSSFIIGYYFNLMWLDSIAMLPLVMCGIERIVDGKSGRLFGLSLFYGLYCNYYIGFMLCLFSCLYFLVIWIGAKKISAKSIWKSCLTFGWYALLAGGMAAVVLVPAFAGLATTESAEGSFPSTWKLFVQNLSQLTSQFAFVEPITIADNQIGVNAFCGVVTMIMGCLYVLDKRLSLRERLSKLALLLFLYASFDVNVLNYIWHGFHVQNGLPNRFAFIYIAMLLVMMADVLPHIRKMDWVRLAAGIALPVGFAAYAWKTGLGEREAYVYLATLVQLAVYGLVLLIYRARALGKRSFVAFLSVFVTAEMAVTAVYGVFCNGTVSRQTYLDDQKAYGILMEEQGASGFFRSDIDSTRMRNCNMFMGADGVVLFSSTMPAATVDLCKALGMEARTNKNGYSGLTKLVNDLFGVKYVVSRNTNSEHLYQMDRAGYETPLAMYENDGALSLGYMVNSAVKDWDISVGNYLEVQDSFIQLATGEEGISSWNQEISMEDGGEYTIDLPAGKQVYLAVSSSVKELSITTPDYSRTIDNYNNHLFDLGCFDTNETATVSCVFKDNQTGPVKADVYVCDDAAYQKVHEKLAENQLEISTFRDEHIKGSITAKTDGTMMLSLPYDTGWTIRVDGEKAETFRIGGALTGVDLSAGTHTITMDYTPAGLIPGTILTLLCVALYVLSGMIEKKKEEQEKKTMKEETEFAFSKKSQMFEAGIFAILNEKKNELTAKGQKVYNLSVGTPDFKTAPHIMEAAAKACENPENYKYALTDRPVLLHAVQDFYKKRFGVDIETDEIMTINGSQEGMAHFALAVCDPGDLVLVPNPGYPIFSIGPSLCDAKTWAYPLKKENGYLPKLDEIPEDIAKQAKYMVVSYPLNPVCAVANDAFYEKLIAFAKKYKIIILHDNAYSDIIYGGRKGGSFLSYPGAKEVGVEFYSLSKSYNLTGARISFVIGNRKIVETFRNVRSQFDYGMFLPLQYAAAAALTGPQDAVEEQCKEYERRMKALCQGLRDIGWNVPDSKGTMFVWAPIPSGFESSEEFCMELVERSGVLCTPGSSFGSLGEGFVRFALVLPAEEMKDVVKAIADSGILKE